MPTLAQVVAKATTLAPQDIPLREYTAGFDLFAGQLELSSRTDAELVRLNVTLAVAQEFARRNTPGELVQRRLGHLNPQVDLPTVLEALNMSQLSWLTRYGSLAELRALLAMKHLPAADQVRVVVRLARKESADEATVAAHLRALPGDALQQALQGITRRDTLERFALGGMPVTWGHPCATHLLERAVLPTLDEVAARVRKVDWRGITRFVGNATLTTSQLERLRDHPALPRSTGATAAVDDRLGVIRGTLAQPVSAIATMLFEGDDSRRETSSQLAERQCLALAFLSRVRQLAQDAPGEWSAVCKLLSTMRADVKLDDLPAALEGVLAP